MSPAEKQQRREDREQVLRIIASRGEFAWNPFRKDRLNRAAAELKSARTLRVRMRLDHDQVLLEKAP